MLFNYAERVVFIMLASVVMTVFNGEDYIEEAIKSILNQSFRDFEYIIINDGSTDGTHKLLAQINDKRVKVYHFDQNDGVANALNFAIAQANGKWIFIQDADDVSLPERLEEQLKFLNEYPDTVVLGSLVHCISGNKSISKDRLDNYPKYWNSIISPKEIVKEIHFKMPFCHGSTAFLKQVFIKAGKYNPMYKIAHDYDLLSRMNEFGHYRKILKVLYHYRIRKDSVAHKNMLLTCNEVMIISSNFIYSRYFKHLNRKPRFYFFGSSAAYPNFIQNVAPNLNMQVYDYCSDETIENFSRAQNLYQEKKIDGIIFLVTNQPDQKSLNYFTNKGFSLNKQLFRFYSLL
jgi:glycosyltransferase involved in cell wall biosynthesis